MQALPKGVPNIIHWPMKGIRDKNGNIEKLIETDAQELEQYAK